MIFGKFFICESECVGAGVTIYSFSTVTKHASLGRDCVIGTCCFINGKLGARCRVQTGCHIGLTAVLGDDVFVGPGTVICDDARPPSKGAHYAPVHVGNRVVLGANVTVLPGVTIHDDVFVGAGSVVTRDVPAGVTVVGNPARVFLPEGGLGGNTCS